MAPTKFVDGRRYCKGKRNKLSVFQRKRQAEIRKQKNIVEKQVDHCEVESFPTSSSVSREVSCESAPFRPAFLQPNGTDDTRGAVEIILQEIPPSPPSQGDMEIEATNSEWEWGGFEIDEKDYPPLVIEEHPDPLPLSEVVPGRRVVNPAFLLPQMERVTLHSMVCTGGKMKIHGEVRTGLYSVWVYKCVTCGLEENVTTNEKLEGKCEINTALVWGALATGIGHSQVEQLMGVLNVPIMTSKMFRKEEKIIEKTWEDHMIEKMKLAGQEERRIAIEKGNITDGMPYITVIGDAGWAKRSYGHGYSSSSRVGVIIGAETKKILFVGVKNAFCCVCARAKLDGKDVSEHTCYRNYTGPATGMEQDVIVEGFRQSIQQHGLVYKFYIGDGDSSTFCRIQERVSYGRRVTKIECANHITCSFSEKLHKLATNTSYPLTARRVLTEKVGGRSRVDRMVAGVRAAIKEAGATFTQESIEQLRKDLLNNPHHVLGNHNNCRESFCRNKDSEGLIPIVKEGGLFAELMKYIDYIVRKADRVAFNETTNQAERFMGLVAKFTGGKRVNYTLRGSYRRRCFGAGLAHTSGPSWHLSPWKRLSGCSPGKVLRRTCNVRHKNMVSRRLLYGTRKRVFRDRRMATSSAPDAEYGPNAAQPDVPEPELQKRMEEVLAKLCAEVQPEKRLEEIRRTTVRQHNNTKWREMRMNRLTASVFGNVMCRRQSTPCHNLVKNILYQKDINTPAVQYGRVQEANATEMYVRQTGNHVTKCGLFIDSQHPFLGASPDGLIGDDGLLEIKCLYSLRSQSLTHAVSVMGRKICMETVDNVLRLRKTHKYYFQVQGQLNICKRRYCDFVVYAGGEITIDRIQKDEALWQHVMLPKLKHFFMHGMLPEIADARIPRNMRVRDLPVSPKTNQLNKKRKT